MTKVLNIRKHKQIINTVENVTMSKLRKKANECRVAHSRMGISTRSTKVGMLCTELSQGFGRELDKVLPGCGLGGGLGL